MSEISQKENTQDDIKDDVTGSAKKEEEQWQDILGRQGSGKKQKLKFDRQHDKRHKHKPEKINFDEYFEKLEKRLEAQNAGRGADEGGIPAEGAAKIVGVRFKNAGKIYYFDQGELSISDGTPVIVETARGMELGKAEYADRIVSAESVVSPLKKVIRAATPEDMRQDGINKAREKEAFGICLEKIAKHNLEMKLIDVEMTFDATKIIFYFSADGRVDFRELVKDLAAVFRMRIELRQIGVRDEAKMLKGVSICGRPLCCSTFLGDFQPVSIKMAKEQGLSLNPTKISGICGRLMCCLKYEEETYEHLNKGMPNVGDIIRTRDGDGEVLSVNVLRQNIRAAVKKRPQDASTIGNFGLKDITILERRAVPDENAEFEGNHNGRGANHNGGRGRGGDEDQAKDHAPKDHAKGRQAKARREED